MANTKEATKTEAIATNTQANSEPKAKKIWSERWEVPFGSMSLEQLSTLNLSAMPNGKAEDYITALRSAIVRCTGSICLDTQAKCAWHNGVKVACSGIRKPTSVQKMPVPKHEQVSESVFVISEEEVDKAEARLNERIDGSLYLASVLHGATNCGDKRNAEGLAHMIVKAASGTWFAK